MGQWFLEDNEGIYYMIFEKLQGEILKNIISQKNKTGGFGEEEAYKLLLEFCETICAIHENELAIGDFFNGDNIMVLNNNKIKFLI
jgi:hypothetical protein